jgi:hypothetical protein
VVEVVVTADDRKVVIDKNGVITVPSAACTGGVSHMKSFLGGLQAFAGDTFMCDVDVTHPGKYRVTVRVVTVHDPVVVPLTVNDARVTASMTIPYTIGKWQQTEPVEVILVSGRNVLKFEKPARGFAFKDITLTAVSAPDNGTLGTQTTMPFGTPEEVRSVVFRNLEIAGPAGGLFFCPTHMLEPEVPWENVEAYVPACKEFKTAGG